MHVKEGMVQEELPLLPRVIGLWPCCSVQVPNLNTNAFTT